MALWFNPSRQPATPHPGYHPVVYDRAAPPGSYWQSTLCSHETIGVPLDQDKTCDVAIIGGGITGLSTAWHLGDGVDSMALVEAGAIAWGGAGRNGGFCCIGATRLSGPELLATFGREETQQFFRDQRAGVELVRQLLQQNDIQADVQGEGEIQVAHTPSRQRQLDDTCEFLTHLTDYPCERWSQAELADRAYRSDRSHGGLFVGVGFGLNPLKYSLGLAQAVRDRGVALHPHSPVVGWEKVGPWHHLRTTGGTLRARRVVIATNGYTPDTLHGGVRHRLLPVLSNIITTRPLTRAELEAQGWRTETPLFDTRNLLYYFRLLADGRLLFGSRGGLTGSPPESDRRRQVMIAALRREFPAWAEVDISHYWNGLVCLSANLTPYIGPLPEDDTVFCGLAYHGNGVATGTWAGRAIAQMITRQLHPQDLCAVLRQPLARFPLPGLRPWYVRLTYGLYQGLDWMP